MGYWISNGVVRTVPSEDRIVIVALALGTTVVVVVEIRQRPLIGTVAVPTVTSPLAVVT